MTTVSWPMPKPVPVDPRNLITDGTAAERARLLFQRSSAGSYQRPVIVGESLTVRAFRPPSALHYRTLVLAPSKGRSVAFTDISYSDQDAVVEMIESLWDCGAFDDLSAWWAWLRARQHLLGDRTRRRALGVQVSPTARQGSRRYLPHRATGLFTLHGVTEPEPGVWPVRMVRELSGPGPHDLTPWWPLLTGA